MLQWTNLTIKARNKNKNSNQKYITILENACGSAYSGRITAIMGPSGSGKTTLLNALAGRIPNGSITNGSILFNNEQRNIKYWLHRCGYVGQDCKTFENLTVEEAVKYTAIFKSKGYEHELILAKVNQTIESFLLIKVSKTLIKKLSGGERKRVLLAMEMVSDSDIMCLDEPTSGLDSFIAGSIVNLLKAHASKYNKTIIVTIHQPSQEIFELFDSLVLMSNGKVIYSSSVAKIEHQFEKFNIMKDPTESMPDFLVKIASNNKLENRQKINYRNMLYKITNSHENHFNKKSVSYSKRYNDYYVIYSIKLEHVLYLVKRRFILEYRQKFQFYRSVVFKFLTMTTCAILFILITRKVFNINSALENIMLFIFNIIILLTMLPTINVFYLENELIKREIALGTFSTSSYYLSVIIYQCGLNIVINTIPYILVLFSNSISKAILFMIYILSVIPSVIFGSFVGSITKSKALVNVLSIITQVHSMLGISYWSTFTLSIKDTNFDFLYKIIAIFSIFNISFDYSQLVAYEMFSIGNLPKSFQSRDPKKVFAYFMKKSQLSSLWGEPPKLWFIIIINLTLTVLTVLCGVVLLGKILRPSIRMNLSKNFINY